MNEADWSILKDIFSGLKIMASGTSLVGNSKVMHHMRPNGAGGGYKIERLSAFGRLVILPFLALHMDGAVLQQGNHGRDRGDNWRQHCSNNARGERELRDRSALVLNDDAPHVPFVHERLQFLDGSFTFGFERLPRCFHVHDKPSGRA